MSLSDTSIFLLLLIFDIRAKILLATLGFILFNDMPCLAALALITAASFRSLLELLLILILFFDVIFSMNFFNLGLLVFRALFVPPR